MIIIIFSPIEWKLIVGIFYRVMAAIIALILISSIAYSLTSSR